MGHHRLGLRIGEGLYRGLKEAAEREGCSMNELVADVLVGWLAGGDGVPGVASPPASQEEGTSDD